MISSLKREEMISSLKRQVKEQDERNEAAQRKIARLESEVKITSTQLQKTEELLTECQNKANNLESMMTKRDIRLATMGLAP